jgi:hypothetical protein
MTRISVAVIDPASAGATNAKQMTINTSRIGPSLGHSHWHANLSSFTYDTILVLGFAAL